MDPELQRALELVQAAREQGRSDREINSVLRRSGLPVNSIRQLEAEAGFQARQGGGASAEVEVRADAARVGNDAAPQAEPAPLLDRARAQLTNIANAFYFGLGDDAVGLVSPRGQEGINQQVDLARQQDPLLSFGGEMGSMAVGAPGRIAAKLIPAAGRVGGRVGARAGGAAAARVGGGDLSQLTGQAIGRTVGTGTGAGTAGAVEGGLIGFGETRPGENRARGAGMGAGLGLVATGPIGSLAGAGGAARRFSRLQREGGENLADALTESGGLLGTHATTRARARTSELASQAYREADPQLFHPANLLDEAADGSLRVNPAVERVLRGSGTEEASGLLTKLDEYAQGGPDPVVRVKDAHKIRLQVKRQADALKRQVPDQASKPDIFRVDEAEAALNLIDEGLEAVPAYTQGQRLTARQNALRRAGATGRQIRSAPADVLEAALRGEQVQLPGSKKTIHLRTPAERQAAVEALAEPMVQKLRGGSGSVKGFLNEVMTSSDTRRKLQLVFGDDSEAWETFLKEAERVRAVNEANRFTEFGIKYAGFIGLGSSIAGGAAVDLINF